MTPSARHTPPPPPNIDVLVERMRGIERRLREGEDEMKEQGKQIVDLRLFIARWGGGVAVLLVVLQVVLKLLPSLVALVMLPVLLGCGAMTPAQARTSTETALGAATAALDVIDDIMPDDADPDDIVGAVRAGLEVGDGLLETWASIEDKPRAWDRWATGLLDLASDTIGVLEAAGVKVPLPVLLGLAGLHMLLAVVGGA